MKRINPVILLLVLLLTFLLAPSHSTTAEGNTAGQTKLVDPSTSRRITNGEKLQRLARETNQLTQEYNKILREAKLWVNIDPEKLAPLARKIADNTEKIAQLLEHYFEVDP